MYAAVVVNKKANALNHIFHYAVPAGMDVRPGMVVEVSFGHQLLEAIVVDVTADLPDPDFDSAKIKEIGRITHERPLFHADLLALSKFLADYYLCSWVGVLQAMLPAGMHLTGRMPKSAVIRTVYPLVLELPKLRGTKQQEALEYIINCPGMPFDQVLEATGVSAAVVRELVKKQLAELREEVVWGDEILTEPLPKPDLTAGQQAAVAGIDAEREAQNRPVLLYGVTGSGKTEVYLDQVEKCLQQGKQVIILVPEIALTPQTVRVFQGRLGSRVAVLHSNLIGSERRKAWLGIAEGQFDVVIGARSAIFAPTPDLGLIIIDEEHESSYKQDNEPRFHTVVAAKKRCELTGAALIMGSATPDLGDYKKAQRGEYKLVELPERIGGRKMAEGRMVDMRKEMQAGNLSMFSRLLQQRLKKNFAEGKQSMLFLNRRGFDLFVSCRSCGHVIECPHCSVAMAYHQGEGRLKCHYCGQTLPQPNVCPVCGSKAIRHFGTGTQKVAQAVQELLPGARIARLDRDSSAERGYYEETYKKMLAGEIDVLVGTQMIAKGLDFPKLTLVGVLAADLSLNLPDFRAGERTFQLLTQVAGRAGRHTDGEVVIQSYQPEHRILQTVAEQDFAGFAEAELKERRFAAYPPWQSLIRFVFSGTVEKESAAAGRLLVHYLQEELEKANLQEDDRPLIWGPISCPKYRIKDRYRLQVMIKGESLEFIRELAHAALEKTRLKQKEFRSVSIVVDVEPLNII